MMDKIINRYASYLLLLGALLCLSACHRSYEPLPRDERQISPEAGGRLHMNQAEIQSRANAYIRQLAKGWSYLVTRWSATRYKAC